MTASTTDFPALLQQVRDNRPEATRALHDLFTPSLLRFACARLDRRVRPKLDPADIVQELWVYFFARILLKQSFDGPEHLQTFLTGLARNKLREQHRHFLKRRRRDVQREESLEDAVRGQDRAFATWLTPDELLIWREEWHRLVDAQQPTLRLALLLLGEGRTEQEVATAIGVSQRTIQRLKQLVLGRVSVRAASA